MRPIPFWKPKPDLFDGLIGVFDVAGISRKNDRSIRALLDALGAGYGTKHARAKIEAYRYNPGSIRVRITDPDFHGLTEVERENAVWPILENLPDDVRSE